MKIVALDFETADYGADSACALGIVSIENGQITKSEARLIKPPRERFVFTYIHGITWDHVRGEADFGDVWEDFRHHWSDADYLVAHNAPFDRKVLYTCCLKAGMAKPETPFICTVRIARTHFKFKPANLAYVSDQLGIVLKHHDAGSDALACATIAAKAMLEGFPVHSAMLGPPSY
jgi:DNA polymerase III subunit epsilon